MRLSEQRYFPIKRPDDNSTKRSFSVVNDLWNVDTTKSHGTLRSIAPSLITRWFAEWAENVLQEHDMRNSIWFKPNNRLGIKSNQITDTHYGKEMVGSCSSHPHLIDLCKKRSRNTIVSGHLNNIPQAIGLPIASIWSSLTNAIAIQSNNPHQRRKKTNQMKSINQ